MDTTSDYGGSMNRSDVKEEALDAFFLDTCKKPLYTIHPRVHNRTETMWRGAITIRTDSKLPTAFKILIDENVLGAPVVTPSNKFYGYIDMMDLVCFTITLFSPSMDPVRDSISEFFKKEDKFNETTVLDLIEFREPGYALRKDKMSQTIPKSCSLMSAFEFLVRRGFDRAAIVNEAQEVESIITQSMLIGWCYNNIDTTLKHIKDIPVSQIHPTTFLSTIQETEPAIQAFKIMAEKKYSGLPVINQEGELVEVVSIRDLRGMAPTAENFLRLWHPIKDFKKDVRAMFPSKTPLWPDLFLIPSDTLKTCVMMFDEDRVHRLFVIRSAISRIPLHIITHSDVLRFLLSTDPTPTTLAPTTSATSFRPT